MEERTESRSRKGRSMAEEGRQKDAMDVLQSWVNDYNAGAGPAIRLGSAGEAGGAAPRLKYPPAEGGAAPLQLVPRRRGRPPPLLVRRFDRPPAGAALPAGP